MEYKLKSLIKVARRESVIFIMALFLAPVVSFAQQGALQGIVTDEIDEPVVGAIITDI